jgi:outer membrane biosynthesis protein TonB
MKSYLSLLIAVLLFSIPVSAQEEKVSVELLFIGAVQPVAVELPLPTYPHAAEKKGGRVSVAVIIDEAGNVTSVDDADGPYPICKSVTDPRILALRGAASEAARVSRFAPVLVDRLPVSVRGRIVYDFKPYGDEAEPLAGSDGRPTEMRLDRITKLGTTDEPTTGVRVVSPGEPKSSSSTPVSGTVRPKMLSGGVLNGKASSLAKPTYPAAAKAVRAGGPVAVQVLIDEQGNLYTAQAVSGHPLLRRNSEIAACDSRFTPTLLEGTPVKVSGVITYNYVP